ncbi:hypothetical protein HYT56_00580 [Candidatus Woesearchaeota archaeon]|nr:hypothetical protein [Candidatus Woesearchaeota archaeon]
MPIPTLMLSVLLNIVLAPAAQTPSPPPPTASMPHTRFPDPSVSRTHVGCYIEKS